MRGDAESPELQVDGAVRVDRVDDADDGEESADQQGEQERPATALDEEESDAAPEHGGEEVAVGEHDEHTEPVHGLEGEAERGDQAVGAGGGLKEGRVDGGDEHQ